MSRIEQVTKYRCDGCGAENSQPAGWVQIVTVGSLSGSFITLAVGAPGTAGEHYCVTCIRDMREFIIGNQTRWHTHIPASGRHET